MIVVENTEFLQILTNATAVTTEPCWQLGGVWAANAAFLNAASEAGATTGITAVNMVTGVSGSQFRIMGLSVYNLDTISHTITIQRSATLPIIKAVVAPGGSLHYNTGAGWTISDANGVPQSIYSPVNLTGDVTSVGAVTTLTNAPVIAKVLTGYISGAGTVSAADSILGAIQKLNGNDATNANLTGPVTSTGNTTAIANGAITNAMLANGAVANLSGTNTGDQTNISGNAATVTTNANLTGQVTSVGNTTTIATAQPDVHTWALAQTFTVAPVFTDQSGSRTALGLGTLATQSGTFSGTSSGTNTGDQTSIVGITGTKAQFDTAVTDGNFVYQSDLTPYATTAYVDNSVIGLLDEKGAINCSTNPNYPVGLKGDMYHVTVAGKIGGASGIDVEVSDAIVCSADNAGGTHAAVGSSWYILEHNLNGAVILGGAGGTPSSIVLTNASGTAAGLTAGTVTTNANLTGHVTSTGNAAILGSFTKAQLDTAVSDGNILYVGDVTTNATHTGDATGSTALIVVAINGTSLAGLATGILKNTTGTGIPSIAVAGTDYLTPSGSAAALTSFPVLNQSTTGSAATLTTPRAIYGNNFDGSAALAQIIASTFGGTGNGFTKFTGPTTAEKTKTLRDATDTILELAGSYTPTGTWTSVILITPTLTFSTSATVTAGTNAQGQGVLTSDYNVITTTTANPSGVTLPTATVGRRILIRNGGTNPINIYPASGGTIDALGVDTAISLAVGSRLEFNAPTTTQWYSSSSSAQSASTLTGTTLPTSITGSSLTSFGANPNLGTPSTLVGTSITGIGAGFTAGNVTTNANLTGHVTSTGNATLLGSFTKAQLDTAVSDGNVVYVGDNISGSAATLTTSRTINGIAFNGSANIDVTGPTLNAAMVAASAAINTTETLLVKSSAMPASRFVAGSTLRITAWGTCTSSAANVSTFRVRIGINGTTVDGVVQAAATAVAATAGTAIPFKIVWDIVIRTVGAAATTHGSMTLLNLGVTGIAAQTTQNVIPTFTTFDSTVASLIVDLTYQSAATSTTCTFQGANIEFVSK